MRATLKQPAKRPVPKPLTKKKPSAGLRGKPDIRILRSKLLDEDRILHAFSTRQGGLSTVYGAQDLNLGFTASDRTTVVERNRKAFLSAVSPVKIPLVPDRAPRRFLVSLKQVHSDVIHVLRSAPADPLAGDGFITHLPGLLLAIQTADCVPVLLADTKKQVVGAFHAGWRGTLKRIVEKGVGLMQVEYGSQPQDICAVIGPCIQGCCYSVGDEVVEEFESQFHYSKELFAEVYDKDPIKQKYPMLFLTARAPGHSNLGPQIHLDLVKANRQQLLDAGVKPERIDVLEYCTSCRKDLLFSHRRESGFTGRMMSVIGLT